nr:MAG TPA: hypothetical protein [Caudoviricetes sp.]DAX57149.1 MAG TPA: hypothetical protein [Crassvirales sp.]
MYILYRFRLSSILLLKYRSLSTTWNPRTIF